MADSKDGIKWHIGSVHQKMQCHQCNSCPSGSEGQITWHVMSIHDKISGLYLHVCDHGITDEINLI